MTARAIIAGVPEFERACRLTEQRVAAVVTRGRFSSTPNLADRGLITLTVVGDAQPDRRNHRQRLNIGRHDEPDRMRLDAVRERAASRSGMETDGALLSLSQLVRHRGQRSPNWSSGTSCVRFC